jgi:ATP-dependent DNA helicase DinG
VTPEDPILDALTERDRDWFMKYSVPKAIIAFKQGFGRLIRTTTDRGVVVVLDKRITTKFYGRYFTDALPPVQRSQNIEDVRRFLDREPIVRLAAQRVMAPKATGGSLFDRAV